MTATPQARTVGTRLPKPARRRQLLGAAREVFVAQGYHAAANSEICLLVQVETKRGLDNLERIASVEGVDGVFVGPGDLSAALGYLGQPAHPEVVKIIDDMIPRIKNAGVAPGILTGDAELAQHYIDLGCLFAAVGSDIGASGVPFLSGT